MGSNTSCSPRKISSTGTRMLSTSMNEKLEIDLSLWPQNSSIDLIFWQRQVVSSKFGANQFKYNCFSGDQGFPIQEIKLKSCMNVIKPKKKSENNKESNLSEIDCLYQSVIEAKQEIRLKRANSELSSFPPLPEDKVSIGQARRITSEMFKNRGLTRSRNKNLKNPRKKNRIRFDRATLKRKGQVQTLRSKAGFY